MKISGHIFVKCLNICAPLVTETSRRPFAPWMNDDIRAAMNERNEAQRILKQDRRTETLQVQYKNHKIYVKNTIRTAKREFYNKEFISKRGNMAATWRVVRQVQPDGNSKEDDCLPIADKVEQLNTYFANVGKNAFVKSQEGIEAGLINQTHTHRHIHFLNTLFVFLWEQRFCGLFVVFFLCLWAASFGKKKKKKKP